MNNTLTIVAFDKTLTVAEAFEQGKYSAIDYVFNKPIIASIRNFQQIFTDKGIGLISKTDETVALVDLGELEDSMFLPEDSIESLFNRVIKEELAKRENKRECYCPACSLKRVLSAMADGTMNEELMDDIIQKTQNQITGRDPKPVTDLVNKLKAEQENESPIKKAIEGAFVNRLIHKRKILKAELRGMHQVIESVLNAGISNTNDIVGELYTELSNREACGCDNCMTEYRTKRPVLEGMKRALSLIDNQGINAARQQLSQLEKTVAELKEKINVGKDLFGTNEVEVEKTDTPESDKPEAEAQPEIPQEVADIINGLGFDVNDVKVIRIG